MALTKVAIVVGVGEAGGFRRDYVVRTWKLITCGEVSRGLGVGRKGVSGLCSWVNGGGPFPDVGNPRTGVGLGKVGNDLQGLCDGLAEVSRRQSDAWVRAFEPKMQIRGHEVKRII